MKRASLEIGASTTFLIISGFALAEASGYRGPSGLMPRGVTFALCVLSLLWLIQSVIALRKADGPAVAVSGQQLRTAAILLAGAVALVWGMSNIGLYTTSLILLPLLGFLFGYRSLRGLIVGTLIFVAVLVGVFRQLLAVPLPPELLLTWFGI